VKNDPHLLHKYAGWIRWIAVVLPLSLFFILTNLVSPYLNNPVEQLLFIFLGLGVSGVFYSLVDRWLALSVQQRLLLHKLQADERRLSTVLRLNSLLVDARDERVLMQSLLSLIGGLVGASGLSYIPLDEWGQPLASVVSGDVPPEIMERWMRHLDSTEVKEICKNCQVLQAPHGAVCPLAGGPFDDSSEIACLPLRRNGQVLGMLNLYLPKPVKMDADMRQFLESLLKEMALAVDTIRLRNQELVTLRQLQMVRGPKMDLTTLLTNLLMDTQQALEVDCALLSIRGTGKIPSLMIQGKGLSIQLDEASFQGVLDEVYKTGQLLAQSASGSSMLPLGLGSILIAPICQTEGPTLGVILVANQNPVPFYPRQIRVLETVAAQAAQLVENERLLLDLEYKAVIEERTRLAREIHDGLAQTLAFLKMQVSQMQNYLAREDLPRLRDVLRTSHRTLSDAYLDARQAIDNLRITPQSGVSHWLQQSLEDFQGATNIHFQLSIQPDLVEIPQEIQAQLIRVVQEALSNIRKHAHASNVYVSLHNWQSDLILEITDDGSGFSPEDVPYISQYGLRGMRERAELIGADFQIISQPNQGTTVRLQLPNPLEETPV